MIYIVATIYFWKINKHWFWFVLVGYIWNLISLIGLAWMPESPRFLVAAGKLQAARKAFQTIAKWNGR